VLSGKKRIRRAGKVLAGTGLGGEIEELDGGVERSRSADHTVGGIHRQAVNLSQAVPLEFGKGT